MARLDVALLFVVLSAGIAWAGPARSKQGNQTPVTATKAPQQVTYELKDEERKSIFVTGGPGGANSLGNKIKEWVDERDAILKDRTKAEDKGSRADQGEHVINNGVTTLYKDIILEFLRAKDIEFDPYGKPTIDNLWRDARDPKTADALEKIEKDLKVHIPPPEKQKYIDTNHRIYGHTIQILKGLAVNKMIKLADVNNKDRATIWDEPLRAIIKWTVEKEIFVDQEAQEEWVKETKPTNNRDRPTKSEGLKERKNTLSLAQRKQEYTDALKTVKTMFENLESKLEPWVRIVQNARNRIIPGGEAARGSTKKPKFVV